MDFSLAQFGFNGVNYVESVLERLGHSDGLVIGGADFIIQMDMWGLIEYQIIQHGVEPRHKTYQSNIGTYSKSDSKGGGYGGFHLGNKMGFGNAQYDAPIDHGSGG